MKARSRARVVLLVASLCVALLVPSAAEAAVGAVPVVRTTWSDTNLVPGGEGLFTVQARNVGDADFFAGLTITDELPAGVTATDVHWEGASAFNSDISSDCSGNGPGGAPKILGATVVTCVLTAEAIAEFGDEFDLGKAPGVKGPGTAADPNPRPSGYLFPIDIEVEIDPAAVGPATNTATVTGGGSSQPASDVDQIQFGAEPLGFGLVPGSYEADFFDAAYPFGDRVRQAGDRPFELRANFEVNLHVSEEEGGRLAAAPNGLIKTVEVALPPGVIGNPESTPKCDPTVFAIEGATKNGTACPPNTQVGYLNGLGSTLGRGGALSRVPIYNLEPPKGVLADFGFTAGGLVQGHIYGVLDPARNYAITSVTPNIASTIDIIGSEVTFWGVPGDPAHDLYRWYSEEQPNGDVTGAPFEGTPIRPFFTNPMDCGVHNGGARIRIDSYSTPGQFTPAEEAEPPLNVEGCDDPRFRFEPDVSTQPTSTEAGGPTGLDVSLALRQRNDEVKDASELYAQNGNVQGIGTPPIKKTVVTLPPGMTISPSAAQGLEACTPEQIGLGTDRPAACPDAAQFGTLSLKSPALPQTEPIDGRVYVAQPFANPFGTLLALYLVIENSDLGILVKLPGRVDLDPITGQITTTFDDLPQLPVSEVRVGLKGGLRAGLVNPQTCGTKTIESTFYSWHDPETPHVVADSFEVGSGSCVGSLSARPFDPLLRAGTTNPVAGAFSPLEVDLTRTDAEQELSVIEASAPPGVTASLRGLSRCSEAQIAAAAAPGRSGTAERAAPSCPASSRVGSVDVGAGVGQVLTYVQGTVYLAGPYKGAPLSGVTIVPALTGPFDLGVVVARAPAYIDPRTARVTLRTDPLPQILEGVPVRVRDVRVHLDRNRFILNPTSCEEHSFDGVLRSTEGAAKPVSSRFQVGSCSDLGFRPRLSLHLSGGTKRAAHPALRATLRPRSGDANISFTAVTLPDSFILDQGHIGTICTKVQFAARACPARSVYGRAVAFSPLLDAPLRGAVYLRSSRHLLPDLVLDLRGEIDVEAAGRIDAVDGALRTTFDFVPDAPISKVVLRMQGGEKGLIFNTRNLCARSFPRALVRLRAHSGKRATLRPPVSAECGKKKRRRR